MKDRDMYEPTDLDVALMERSSLGADPVIGPLTREDQERVDAYYAWCEEQEAEHEREMAAGGKSRCPSCGSYSVTHNPVLTYGVPGHPGSEYSDFAACVNPDCDWEEVAG